jgi:hypothetical protein
MVKEIKSDGLAVNWGKMWIKFVDHVKNFHNLKIARILGIGLGKGGKLAGIKLPCSQKRIELIQQFNYVPALKHYSSRPDPLPLSIVIIYLS